MPSTERRNNRREWRNEQVVNALLRERMERLLYTCQDQADKLLALMDITDRDYLGPQISELQHRIRVIRWVITTLKVSDSIDTDKLREKSDGKNSP